MTRLRRSCILSLSVLLCGLGLPSAIAQNNGLKIEKNPGGGEIVYGPVANQTTPQGAMAAVLHTIHTQFGDRPQVGKAFQSRGSDIFGVFFTVVAKTQGNQPIAGLVIVSMAKGASPAAAILFDDSSRFAKTEPVLMRMLAQAWKTASTGPAAASGGNVSSRGPVPALTPTRFPDGSGAVSLPPGWTIPFSSHGAAKILGPRGETVLLGNSFGPIYDPSDPAIQSQMRYANPNARRTYFLCPQGDALHTYECLLQQSAANGTPSLQIKKSQPIAPSNLAPQGGILIDADIDQHDGRGMMACELGLTLTGNNAMGHTLHLNGTCAPQSSAAQEQPTLKAIFDSYTLDSNVVSREYANDEARSRQAGANARVQANSAHAAEDAQASAFNAHMDNIDRMSKSFQNYQLDNTELQDNNQNTRGAVPNDLANALIKSDPNRFQSVATPDFLKGVDY